eukprot:CAMPEP_0176118042 /NCGR_PEP_ID=MMETSP0120_2-20121206/59311_1 /TAXON_ID=160619 /ORGANISM="Kryptoperidinium foliaceum, Strain CCMP 1326" /LENGTH=53 /DNA_ID=CAMNT_0017452355 /DNA_START=27 /DNA_END=184 /DNA_ORIENTATION=+
MTLAGHAVQCLKPGRPLRGLGRCDPHHRGTQGGGGLKKAGAPRRALCSHLRPG